MAELAWPGCLESAGALWPSHHQAKVVSYFHQAKVVSYFVADVRPDSSKATLSTPSKMSILKLKMRVMVAALH
jgi:hypothetical protein